MRRATELHLKGEVSGAEALYSQILRAQPQNAGALHMLGVLATQSGNAVRAVDLIARSIAIDPNQAAAYSNLGNALMTLGRYAEAIESFNRALALRPRYAIALVNRGISLIHLGDFGPAIDSLSSALDAAPYSADTLVNRGIALARLGRLEEAIVDYDGALRLRPDYIEPAFHRAVLLARLGRLPDAIEGYDRVLALDAGHAEALNHRGAGLIRLGRFEEALPSLERALILSPSMAEAHGNRGLALGHLKRLDSALDSLDRALELRPDFADALSTRGWVLLLLGRRQEAISSLEKAVALKPGFVEAWTVLGTALKSCERLIEALGCFDRALAIDAECEDALGSRGVLLIEAQRYAEALVCLKRLRALAPENDYALGNVLEAQMRCCDWSEYSALRADIVDAVARHEQAVRPLFFLAVADDPAGQLACARMYADRHYACFEAQPFPSRSLSKKRIRLAYVSGDLRDHAVSYLAAGLFERHDRKRFDVVAVSLRPAQDSVIGRRVRAGVDEFLDVSSMSDEQIVARMRALDVDIAIDLSGYTGAGRTGIFARRAAPVQVNYLGFPATMGAPWMDYIIADEFLIPPHARHHYAEQVVYLPNCFQANDDRREIDPATPSRRDQGLPERGLVFCSFNNSYKLNPAFLDVWLRLLAAVPESVLWLVGDNEWAEENLRRFAQAQGISPERLIFARRLPYAAHLARLGLADLCLDSLPFNAGTTASDALWAGVPILTCAGSGFAARMAGSLLRAVGLPGLITYNIEDYESLGLRLARDPALLANHRVRLTANRLTSPLFDTARFCRHIESAYTSMWDRYRRGEAAAAFCVRNLAPTA
ncbi:MAG TPA: tetratricopeptide repeat protein [Steroidobacteraceae bacterium]